MDVPARCAPPRVVAMAIRAVLTRPSTAAEARDWISTPPVDKCVHEFGERLRKAPRIKGLLDSGENLTKAGFDS